MDVGCRHGRLVLSVAAGCVALLSFTGCKGCGSDDPDSVSEPDTAASEDTASPEPTDTIDTAAAEKQADEEGFSTGRRVSTQAKYIAGEMEPAEDQGSNRGGASANPDPVPTDPEGNISRSKVQQIFLDHKAETRACYERVLKKNPALAGKVIVTVTVGSDGSVARVNAQGRTLLNQQVNNCLEARIRGWQFPEPNGGAARVQKPFNFAPQR